MSKAVRDGSTVHPAQPAIFTVVEDLTASLRGDGIADPRRVANDIIAALLEVSRSWPVSNQDSSLEPGIVASARMAAHRLAKGAPFAYAVGTAPFRHLNLQVDERVLIPRPETEVLVSEVMAEMSSRYGAGSWGTAIDIGTGSGAIALSLANEGRFERVIATDASVDALDVALANLEKCETRNTRVELRHGSLMAPVTREKANLVVTNPPYIAFGEMDALPSSVRNWEPPLALFSGHDGLAATAAIVRDSAAILLDGGLLALEVDERRASLVAELIMRHGCFTDVGVRLDLTGRERFVLASRLRTQK